MIIVMGCLADEHTSRFPPNTIRLDGILPIALPHKPFLVLLEAIRTATDEGEGGVIGELQGIGVETE